MPFRTAHTLAGHARVAVETKTRMRDHCATVPSGQYIRAFVETRWAALKPGDQARRDELAALLNR